MKRYTLSDYKTHVDHFGGDTVLETAASDLPESQLESLALYIKRHDAMSDRDRLAAIKAKAHHVSSR